MSDFLPARSAPCCLTLVVVASIKRRLAAVLRGVESLFKHEAALLVRALNGSTQLQSRRRSHAQWNRVPLRSQSKFMSSEIVFMQSLVAAKNLNNFAYHPIIRTSFMKRVRPAGSIILRKRANV